MKRSPHPIGSVCRVFGDVYDWSSDERCRDRDTVAQPLYDDHVICVVVGHGRRRGCELVVGPTFVGWVLFDWHLRPL